MHYFVQGYSLEEIEELCSEQIAVMSKKRITSLINGNEAVNVGHISSAHQ